MARKAKQDNDETTVDEVYVSAQPREATIIRLKNDGVSPPMVLCKGYDRPQDGETFEFMLANGVAYKGEVKETTTSDGELLVEFVDGVEPVRK